jgi:cell division protease FtsH
MKSPENQNPRGIPQRKFPWLWYVVAVLLIGIFISTFVLNNMSSGITYSSASLSGTVTVDEANHTISVTNGGELTNILVNEEVTSISRTTHTEAGYTYIKGSYKSYNKEKTSYSVQSFTCTISTDDNVPLTNFQTIINNRWSQATDGTYSKYYTGSRGLSIVDYTTQTNWTNVIVNGLLWVVIIGLGIYLLSKLMRSFSSSIGGMSSQQMNFNSSRAKRETHTNVKFKDVAGCDEVKAELVELVDYFKNAKAYTRLGAKLPKGFLLVGPPGTGKTLLAKAVAGEANVPFYSISGSDFVEMYVGVGAGRVRDMFKTAKQNAPCLVFIDEIDAVGRQRGAGMGGGNDEREQTLNQLLVEMDGFEDNSGVIVMAATNRSDVLDPALTRAGRFDRQITVDLPDKEGREAILKVHSRNKVINKDVDFAAIAGRTVGFSGADLANILNDAAILAVREKKNAIDMDDIDEAIDRSIAGPAKTNKGMSDAEKRRVAYHESGHAVIGIRLQHSEKVQRITIIPRGRTGGHVLMTPEADRFVLTKQELIAQITGLLGGRTSEEIFFGDVSTGASNDIEQATRIARTMVTEYGMSDLGPIQYERNTGSVFLGRDYTQNQANYSTQVAYEIDKAVRDIIESAHENCVKLLNQYKDDVELIAKTLLENETITAEQIDYLIEHRCLPPKENKEETKVNTSSTPTPEIKPEVKEETKEEVKTESKPLSSKAEEFLAGIKGMNGKVSQIVIFCEDDNGDSTSVIKANKIIRDVTNAYIAKTQGLGEQISDKIKTGAVLIVAKELWQEFASNSEDFGNFVEQTSGVEVTFVKVDHDSISKLEKMKKNNGTPTPSTTTSKKAKDVSKSLKDAVKEEQEDQSSKK